MGHAFESRSERTMLSTDSTGRTPCKGASSSIGTRPTSPETPRALIHPFASDNSPRSCYGPAVSHSSVKDDARFRLTAF
jgi:hypothetical protein